ELNISSVLFFSSTYFSNSEGSSPVNILMAVSSDQLQAFDINLNSSQKVNKSSCSVTGTYISLFIFMSVSLIGYSKETLFCFPGSSLKSCHDGCLEGEGLLFAQMEFNFWDVQGIIPLRCLKYRDFIGPFVPVIFILSFLNLQGF
ncbi:hypothetical protein H311_01165, partial [Anncaliia algerae PRA109]